MNDEPNDSASSALSNPFLQEDGRVTNPDHEFVVPDEVWESRDADPNGNHVFDDRYFGGESKGFGRELGIIGTTVIGMVALVVMFFVIEWVETSLDQHRYAIGFINLMVMPGVIAVTIPLLACRRFSIRFAVASVVALTSLATFLIVNTTRGRWIEWHEILSFTQLTVSFVMGLMIAPVFVAFFCPWTLVDSSQRLNRLPRTGIGTLMELSAISAILICYLMIRSPSNFSAPGPTAYLFTGLAGLGASFLLTPLLLYLLRPTTRSWQHWAITLLVVLTAAAILNLVVLLLSTDAETVKNNLPTLAIATSVTGIAFLLSVGVQVTWLRITGWQTINQVEVRTELNRLQKDKDLTPETSPLD